MVRHRKGKPGHNDIRKCISRHIDTSPKTIGSQQNTALVIPELLQEPMTGILFTLNQQPPSLLPTHPLNILSNPLKTAVTREQHESPSIAPVKKALDPLCQSLSVFGRCWIRHRLNHMNVHLLPIIEWTADLQGLDPLSSHALPEITQIGISGPESCTGENSGFSFREKQRSKAGGNINRRSPHCVGSAVRPSGLHPVDASLILLIEKQPQCGMRLSDPSGSLLDFSPGCLIINGVSQ